MIYCSVCNAELSRELVTVESLGHIQKGWVIENRVEPTATENGSYDLVGYCSVCGDELRRDRVEVPAIGEDDNADDNQDENTPEDGENNEIDILTQLYIILVVIILLMFIVALIF